MNNWQVGCTGLGARSEGNRRDTVETLEVWHRGKASWGGDPLGTLRLALGTTLFRMRPHLEGIFHLFCGDKVADMIAQAVREAAECPSITPA